MKSLLTFIAAMICTLQSSAQTVAPDTTSRNEVAEGLLTVLLPAIAEKDSTKNIHELDEIVVKAPKVIRKSPDFVTF